MKQYLFSIILLFLFITQSNAQNKNFDAATFPTQPIQLAQAQKDLSEGMKLYKEGIVRYKKALPLLEKAHEFNPDNANLNYTIGMCYMYSSFKGNAKDYFEKAYKLDNNVAPDIHYWIGMGYHLINDWDKSRKEYEKHKEYVLTTKNNEKELKKINKRLEEVSIGEKMVKKPVRVKIENLGPEINSPYTDYGPIISADEDVLMFTSRRPGTTAGPEGDKDESIDEYWEDIYQSFSFGNKWTKAKNIGPPVNTDVHDATNNLSPNGEKLFIYIDDQGQGDVYECDLVNLQWSKPVKMKAPINTKYHESSATINVGLDTMYFISERPGGLGGRDIYRVVKNPKSNKWEDLQNVGPTLNTEYDEEGVFLMPGSKTMYFSSQGHSSMGGFDIFKTTYENGQWTTPVNIGYPINTSDDDVFFVISANGLHGYYASYKKDGFGEKDIYIINFLDSDSQQDTTHEEIAEGPLVILGTKTPTSALLKGKVVDQYNQNPIENATLEIIDTKSNQIIEKLSTEGLSGYYGVWVPSNTKLIITASAPSYKAKIDTVRIPPSNGDIQVEKNIALMTKSDVTAILKGNVFDAVSKKPLQASIVINDNISSTQIVKIETNTEGYYEVAIPTGKKYELIVKSQDYQTAYEYTNIPVSQKNQEIIKDVPLNSLAVGSKIILKNVFYDFDKATLRPQSIIELDHLIQLLNEYPNMRIELSSHTDNKGTADYNIYLSNARSKSCVDYLVSKGVSKLRLEYKGYGLTQPIATNDTDEGRQLNRRTEFKILSK
ncbi:MAG: OmpA family protein [Bacteroidia bacterium]|nr:OmpA family protein [Bacteroidia bacterium]MCZ2249725.1 OmpA family protein [Bacteroidia bacterium]